MPSLSLLLRGCHRFPHQRPEPLGGDANPAFLPQDTSIRRMVREGMGLRVEILEPADPSHCPDQIEIGRKKIRVKGGHQPAQPPRLGMA